MMEAARWQPLKVATRHQLDWLQNTEAPELGYDALAFERRTYHAEQSERVRSFESGTARCRHGTFPPADVLSGVNDDGSRGLVQHLAMMAALQGGQGPAALGYPLPRHQPASGYPQHAHQATLGYALPRHQAALDDPQHADQAALGDWSLSFLALRPGTPPRPLSN